ncbi:plasmid replication/partition related protein [Lampropedia puyangensis]|uniref:Plasmid replication/partition related protein n=1 Tax=Lampropedia puyangensis TaxID=1330072 RepID=A0A4S8FDK5_9BURK|nr:plasmid replication/partition related protein [Lampropedia puyangensis]THU05359.1 plasmid replication/partition related protein [Lampropedia puyangensis]
MDIEVKEELKAYIDPLSEDEYAALERSIVAEGCRDALVLWGNVLIDGHNRYSICQKHGLPFQTVQNTRFQSMEDVYLWMIDQHLGRRSVSDFQRGVLALRKREILQNRRQQQREAVLAQTPGSQEHVLPVEPNAEVGADSAEAPPPWEGDDSAAVRYAPAVDVAADVAEEEAFNSREALAKAARLSSSQVQMIEKIQKQATPEVVAALRAGDISLSAAATVATLPEEEQRAAAVAGADELKQAAKRVRDAKRKSKEVPPKTSSDSIEVLGTEDVQSELVRLRQRVAELTAENEALKQQLQALNS